MLKYTLPFLLIVLLGSCNGSKQAEQNESRKTEIDVHAEPNKQSGLSQNKTNLVTTTSKQKSKPNNQLRAAVKENGSWDYIRTDGSYITKQKFTIADNYTCGKACVSKTGERHGGLLYGATYYFIDKNGKPGKLKFYDLARYHEDRAVVVDTKNKMALIDLDENFIVSGFDQIGRISEGLAYAHKGNITGYINKEGQWAFQVEQGIILSQFQEGLAMAKKDGKAGYLNKKGEWQIEPTWNIATVFSDGYAIVAKDSVYRIIDKNGTVTAEPDGDYFGGFTDGLCAMRKNGKWGYIDNKGSIVIDIIYDACWMFSEGYAAVWVGDNIGFIDTTGKMIIEPKFKYAFNFKNGLAMVASDKTLGYIDISGEFVIPPRYERVHYFEDIDETNLKFKPQ